MQIVILDEKLLTFMLGSLESAWDFLLVLIELFSLQVLRLTWYERILLENRRCAPTESIWPNISGRRGRRQQSFFVSEN